MGRNVIFNPGEIIEACKKAEADGGERPLARVFSVEETARSGPNGTKYMGLFCTTPGKRGRLIVRFTKEKHVGQIAPLDDTEVARINAERGGGKYGVIKKRDRHPTVNVQKYPVKVETDEQGQAKGDLPDKISEYYTVVALVDDFFYEEMQARLADGRITLRDPRRKDYPPNAVVVPSTKIIPMMQTRVSMEAQVNPGSELANPICRINMKFDKETGIANELQVYDFTRSYRDQRGRRGFELLTFDGHPVTAQNVHMIRSHSIVSGIANLNAVCASNMGLSIPTEVKVLIVEPPPQFGVGVDDVFEDNMFSDDTSEKNNRAKPLAARAAEALALAPEMVSEDDLAGVLDDLRVGDE